MERLQLGQELLIIHGKYLEKMLNNENAKMKLDINQYTPPETSKNAYNLPNFSNTGTQYNNNTFMPKANS